MVLFVCVLMIDDMACFFMSPRCTWPQLPYSLNSWIATSLDQYKVIYSNVKGCVFIPIRMSCTLLRSRCLCIVLSHCTIKGILKQVRFSRWAFINLICVARAFMNAHHLEHIQTHRKEIMQLQGISSLDQLEKSDVVSLFR